MMGQLDLIDICRTFRPQTMNFTFFSSTHRTFSRIGHILGHKSSRSKHKKKKKKERKEIKYLFSSQCSKIRCQLQETNKMGKILKEMGIPEHLTCLLRNLYAGQEATVKTGHERTDWFKIGKGVHQSCIWSPCLFNLYAEYIMRNAGLEEAQAGIKIARRKISNLDMQMTLPLWQKVKKK